MSISKIQFNQIPFNFTCYLLGWLIKEKITPYQSTTARIEKPLVIGCFFFITILTHIFFKRFGKVSLFFLLTFIFVLLRTILDLFYGYIGMNVLPKIDC